MKHIQLVLVTILLPFSIIAQVDFLWDQRYGGNNTERYYDVDFAHGGGYIFTGIFFSDAVNGDISETYGGQDVWLVKISENGEIEWEKTYGGSKSDQINDISRVSSGGYIMIGESTSVDYDVSENFGQVDIWVVKISNNGEIEWEKTIGGGGFDHGMSIEETSDGGFFLGASYNSNSEDLPPISGKYDILACKLNAMGDVEWQQSYGGSVLDFCDAVLETSDGNFILAGISYSSDSDFTNQGETDLFVLKISQLGEIIWQSSIGGEWSDFFSSIQETSDDGFIISGSTDSYFGDIFSENGERDCVVVKLNSLGEVEWSRSYGGPFSERGGQIKQQGDGTYTFVGGSFSNTGDLSGNLGSKDAWLVNLSSEGEINWQTNFGDDFSNQMNDLLINTDGTILLAGVSESKVDTSEWGWGYQEIWLTKVKPNVVDVINVENSITLNVFPNPAKDILNVQNNEKLIGAAYHVINLNGDVTLKGVFDSQNTKINISSIVPGQYNLRTNFEGVSVVKKFIKYNN